MHFYYFLCICLIKINFNNVKSSRIRSDQLYSILIVYIVFYLNVISKGDSSISLFFYFYIKDEYRK